MKIEVLGTGCAKCNMLENAIKKVADRLGLVYTLDHVKDITQITEYGVRDSIRGLFGDKMG